MRIAYYLKIYFHLNLLKIYFQLNIGGSKFVVRNVRDIDEDNKY